MDNNEQNKFDEFRKNFDNNNNNNNNGNNNNGDKNGKKNNGQMIMSFIMISLVVLFLVSLFSSRFSQMSSKETTYTEFLQQLEAGNVKTVTYDSYEMDYTLVEDTALMR